MVQLTDLDWLPREDPVFVDIGSQRQNSKTWRKVVASGVECHIRWGGEWGQDGWLSSNVRGKIVKVAFKKDSQKAEDFIDKMKHIEFELGAFSSGPWGAYSNKVKYDHKGFADMHFSHGWACAFKGKGHERLVSRRWLEWGPWRLIRDEENDLSFVQFHDLDLAPNLALEQARPGHQRMGIHQHGGFLQTDYVYKHNLKGIYQPSTQVLEIVVNDRKVSQREMLDACAARHYQALGETRPLKNVAFIFFNEEEARAHLHELWLRELECWTFIDGFKTRLDDSYDPGKPVKPDWVLELEASGSA